MPTTKLYLHSIDLSQNQLINGVLHNSATDPLSPVDGQIYYNTTTKSVKYYNSTTSLWAEVGGGANIYTTDGTLAGNRVVTVDDKQLVFRFTPSSMA
jgi:hypothetical protein